MNSRIDNAFTIFVALCPIIGCYKSFVSGVNLAEIILIGFVGLFIIDGKLYIAKKGPEKILVLFMVYIIFVSLISVLFNKMGGAELTRTIRFGLYFFVVSLLCRKHIDHRMFIKWTKIVAIVSGAFIILQYILFYAFGKVQLGVIQNLLYFSGYAEHDYEMIFSNYFRPSAFFVEPAQMAQYLCMPFSAALLYEQKIDTLTSIFCLIGMLLSTSGQAVVFLATLLLITAIVRGLKNQNRNKLFKSFLVMIFGFIVVSKIMSTELFSDALKRLNPGGTNSPFYARMHVYTYAFFDKNFAEILFGNGYGSVPTTNDFVPGLVYILYGAGIVGTFVFAAFLFYAWWKGSSFEKSIVALFAITLVGANIITNVMMIPYITLMLKFSDKKEIVTESCFQARNAIHANAILRNG